MIPLSSRIEKYRKIEKKILARQGRCDTIHIMRLDNDRESAFLIQDMFPITKKYILREYTIKGNHLKVTSEHQAKTILKKAIRVRNLLKRGIKFTPTQPNIQKIEEKIRDENI